MTTWATKVDQRLVGQELVISNEAHTIGEDIANVVLLNEVPLSTASVTVTGYTVVTGVPAAGQCRVTYTGRMAGMIEFNAANNGAAVQVSYTGRGSNLFARDINRMQAEKVDRDGAVPMTGDLNFQNKAKVGYNATLDTIDFTFV